MVKKATQRTSDRRKLIRYSKFLEFHFISNLQSDPFCNRCKNILPIDELEVNHINYDEFWRFAELVCKDCHKKIDTLKTLPKFEKIREIAPQTILAFQKDLPGLLIESRLTNGKLIIMSRIRIPKGKTLSPRLPLSFI